MKKLAIIFAVIFFASAIAFGITVPIFGFVNDEEMYNMNGENKNEYTYNDVYTAIEVGVISCDVTISKSTDNNTYINYESKRSSNNIEAYVSNNTLHIKENTHFVFSLCWWGTSAQLEIKLPSKTYESFKYNTVSGNAEINDIIAENGTINTTSGDIYVSMYANNMNVNTVSGNVNVTNSTKTKCKTLTTNTTSGNVNVTGFTPEQFHISSVSGNTTVSGLGGTGTIDLTSGDFTAEFAEWTGDVRLSAISGNMNLKLPQDAGANISFSGLSGSVRSALNGNNVSIQKGGSSTVGGTNIHNISVSLTSGDVNIYN